MTENVKRAMHRITENWTWLNRQNPGSWYQKGWDCSLTDWKKLKTKIMKWFGKKLQ